MSEYTTEDYIENLEQQVIAWKGVVEELNNLTNQCPSDTEKYFDRIEWLKQDMLNRSPDHYAYWFSQREPSEPSKYFNPNL